MDNQGNTLIDIYIYQIKANWKNYIDLFLRAREVMIQSILSVQRSNGSDTKVKRWKSSWVDNFYLEFLKIITTEEIKWLTALFNNMWNSQME